MDLRTIGTVNTPNILKKTNKTHELKVHRLRYINLKIDTKTRAIEKLQ